MFVLEACDESDQSDMGSREGIRTLRGHRAHPPGRHDPGDPLLALSQTAGSRAGLFPGVELEPVRLAPWVAGCVARIVANHRAGEPLALQREAQIMKVHRGLELA